jgi:hypothetical protein
MPKPKTTPDLTPKPYRLLKSDIAAKLSPRSQGGISYVLLADTSDTPELHIAVTANEGGGLWSKEAVALTTLEAVIDAHAAAPFPTKALRGAMVGRSSNNPPFCLAVLKDLGLVAPAPDKAHQHVKAGDWAAFREEWLAKPGEPVIYPEPKPDMADATPAKTFSAPSEAEPAAPVTVKGKKRKKDVENVHRTDAGETGADDTASVTDLRSDEADHAPTAHA